MIVYAESSAVLSWLFGEPRGSEARSILESAEFVVTSDLTLIECDRALHRARSLDQITPSAFEDLSTEIRRIASGWILLRLSDEIVARARDAFPEEPIRSLDALHLASALANVALIPETAILNFDDRIQRCSRALGMTLLPESD